MLYCERKIEEYKIVFDYKRRIIKTLVENIEFIKEINQKEITNTGIGNAHDKVLAISQKVAHVQELMLCIEKFIKSLKLEIRKLSVALMIFDRNKIPPLYKGDKSVYTLDEMKAFYEEA